MKTWKTELKGNWNQIKGKVKQQWGQLTEDDLTSVEGSVDELVGKIQEVTGETIDTIENWFEKNFVENK